MMELNFCDIKRKQNKHLQSITCCMKCHGAHEGAKKDGAEPDVEWVCCEMFHYENVYRPTTRAINSLTS